MQRELVFRIAVGAADDLRTALPPNMTVAEIRDNAINDCTDRFRQILIEKVKADESLLSWSLEESTPISNIE